MWAILSRNRDAGLLFLRLALGGFFFWAHGWSKLAGGMEVWVKLGGAMKVLGISFWPGFWGFLATMAESIGCVLIVLGLAFRPACLLLAITMLIAGVWCWNGEKSYAAALAAASHAWELGIVFFAMIFIGPGRFSVDRE